MKVVSTLLFNHIDVQASLLTLWCCVRFVRREKEISETKCESAQSESMRYQQRCEYLQGQIEEFQKNITEEETQSEIITQTAVQHQEVMEKVQKLNELVEANKILENEKESAEKTVRELVAKVWYLLWALTKNLCCIKFKAQCLIKLKLRSNVCHGWDLAFIDSFLFCFFVLLFLFPLKMQFGY